MTRNLILALAIIVTTGCCNDAPIRHEETGMGTVYISPETFWDSSTLTHYGDGGYVKFMSPLCSNDDKLLRDGQRVNIQFHWAKWECYKIDGAKTR